MSRDQIKCLEIIRHLHFRRYSKLTQIIACIALKLIQIKYFTVFPPFDATDIDHLEIRCADGNIIKPKVNREEILWTDQTG